MSFAMSARCGWFGAHAGCICTVPTMPSASRAIRMTARGEEDSSTERHQVSASGSVKSARKLIPALLSTASSSNSARPRTSLAGAPFPMRSITTGGAPRLAFDQLERRFGLQREPSAPRRHDLEVGALLLKPVAQEDEAAFEVVLHGGQAERRVHTHLTVGELGTAGPPRLAEHLPQDSRGYIPDQVLVVHEDRIVVAVIREASRRAARFGRRDRRGRDGFR